MEKAGNDFDKIKTCVPSPPGFATDSLTIYMPRKLSLQGIKRGKHVDLNEWRGTVMDEDEDKKTDVAESVDADNEEEEISHGGSSLVKIPVSYLHQWVHIVAGKGAKILVNELDAESLVIEGEKGAKGLEARERILHPMMKRLLDSVNWHSCLEVYDYVYSVSRSYNSKIVNYVTLSFRDEQGDLAIGRYFLTEGISIVLNPETVKETVSSIKREMLSYENNWAPSVLNAYAAYFGQLKLTDGMGVSPFKIDDLFGVLITAIASDFSCRKICDLPKTLRDLIGDEKLFKEVAEKYYVGKYFVGQSEEETFVSELSKQDKMDIARNVNQLFSFVSHLQIVPTDLETVLENWIVQTLLNTFGLSALSAMQRLCGSSEQEIGYTLDLDGLKNNEYRVFLYDRTHHGNGSSDVLRRYLHILNIQRHRQTDESRLLPTEDYLTFLEQELLQCPQFHTDMDALQKHKQKRENKPSNGIPELGYIGEYSAEVLQVCEKTWNQLGIEGREDAWKLPIIAFSPGSFARSKGLEIDDVIRATAICWNGCPECVVNTGAMIGSSGKAFVDKAVLDAWFKIGRAKAEEYKVFSVKELIEAESKIEIGKQSRICLELPNRKIRSISLPFTIGFELDRTHVLPNAQLIIRDDDIQDFRVFENGAGASSHGIESLGFKRIMWYNLMTSAYLDILGLLKTDRKEISFVYYDCREITFEDIGISPRMIQAIEYHRRMEGIKGELNSLSDMLVWLAKRNFRIQLCVDEYKSHTKNVRDFLKKLQRAETGNISIRAKRLPAGLMHKKALITPVGVIQGSANLTYSGTILNEEIINFAPFGVHEYDEMKVNIKDTFHGSQELNL